MIDERVWDFYAGPTIENAERILDAMKVDVPYRILMRVLPTMPITAPKSKSQSAKRARTGGANANAEAKIHALSRLDFLHDIKGDFPLPASVVDLVLSDSGLPADEHAKVVKACSEQNRNITTLFAQMMGIGTSKKRKASLDAAFTKDDAIYHLVTKWQQQPTLQIVMDGLVDECCDDIRKVEQSPKAKRQFLQSLCLHAFVMLILGRYDAVKKLVGDRGPLGMSVRGVPPSAVKEIWFLYGTFQTMDMGGWQTFMNKWIAQLRGYLQPGTQKVDIAYIAPHTVKPFSNRFHVTRRAVIVDGGAPLGASVPIRPPKPPKRSLSLFDQIQSTFAVRQPKAALDKIIIAFQSLTETERQQWTPFMRRVMDINSFRDTYKADVALRLDAVYITFDRLAYAYYDLRRDAESLGHNGLFYSVGGASPCAASLRDCARFARPITGNPF